MMIYFFDQSLNLWLCLHTSDCMLHQTTKGYANAFAHSKVATEQVIQQLALANPQTCFTILRPQGLFGRHDNTMLPRLLQMIKRYGSVLLPRGGEALVDMTYLENAVHAMWLTTQKENLPSGRAYNITNQQAQPLQGLVQQLID